MNKKIKLTDLKVKSFVTALSDQEKAVAKGGEFTDILGNIPYTLSNCPVAQSICAYKLTCTPYNVTNYATCEYCSKTQN